MIVVPEEEETEEDSKPSEQFEPAEINGVWLKTFTNKKINGYLMFEFYYIVKLSVSKVSVKLYNLLGRRRTGKTSNGSV